MWERRHSKIQKNADDSSGNDNKIDGYEDMDFEDNDKYDSIGTQLDNQNGGDGGDLEFERISEVLHK